MTEQDQKFFDLPPEIYPEVPRYHSKFLYLVMKYITNESYGDFNVSIPANKLLIGLPATQDAASDGYATPQDIKKTYQLCQKYNLKIRGLMS